MRRTDREITGREEILAVLRQCDCCRLGLCDGERPYVVPVNFGTAEENGRVVIYIHGASAGKKLELLRKNPNVCIEADRGHRLLPAETACAFSMEYESVIGFGKAELLTSEAAVEGLDAIMKQYAPEASGWTYDPAVLSSITVIRIPLDEMTGKRLKR